MSPSAIREKGQKRKWRKGKRKDGRDKRVRRDKREWRGGKVKGRGRGEGRGEVRRQSGWEKGECRAQTL